jgi:TM2 domain-containing membrane protein YozV
MTSGSQRYFLSVGDGKTYGPYTVGELRVFVVQGRVTTASMLCAEGTTAWLPADSVLGPLGGMPPGSSPPIAPPPPAFGSPPFNPAAKSRLAAGLFGVLLGALGIHNFYLGYTGRGIAQLLISILTCGWLAPVAWIWGLIEGILIFTGSIATDAKGVPLRD